MVNDLLLIVCIVIWGYALTGILKMKKSFGPILGIAVSMGVLELGGAFGMLWPVAVIYCFAAGILSVAYIVGTRNKADMRAYFLNPSIIGFLFAALFYIVLTLGKTLFYVEWDSFMHWGLFSKAVFYNHNLDVWNNDLWVNHEVYPHGMASWYSLFVLGRKIYTEREIMLSINVLLFAAACPVVDIAVCRMRELLPSKKMALLLLYLLSGISVASMLWFWRFGGETWSYKTGYMDIPLGAVFMAALCLAVTDSGNYYRKAVGVSLLSAMLVMIKPSGIIFVGAVCMVYLAYECINKGFHMTSKHVGKIIEGSMLCVSFPLLELVVWNAMMKYLGISGGDQFRLKSFLPSNVIAKYQEDSAYVQFVHVVIHNFIKTFFTKGIAQHISSFFWMVLCVAIAVFTIILQKDSHDKKKTLSVNICMLLGFCGYNLFLLWTYLTTMTDGEAVSIKCYDRYVGTYLIGWFGVCIYLLLLHNIGGLKVSYLYLSMFFLCNLFGFLHKNTYLIEIYPEVIETYELSNEIKACIPEAVYDGSGDMPDLWLAYANEDEAPSSFQTTQLKYYLFPEFDFININVEQDDYQSQMKDIVTQFSFDFVVLYGVNEDFYNAYYWFFADGLSNAREQYESGKCQAYKVIRDEDTGEFRWFEPIL